METILGIDFGTTNSEVAVFKRGAPSVIPNRDGEKVMPSAVFIEETGRHLVGTAAKNVAVLHPKRTVLSVKRELGSLKRYRIDGTEYEPEQIAAFVFAALKDSAEKHLGGKCSKAVVTVPAYFDDPKRQATKKAAVLAGLEVVRLVNEPTAAALAYGVNSKEEQTILVYDLGGGTFDVSVLQAGEGVFQVLATRGDSRLGGDDFDRKIAELLFERFKEETGIDLKTDRLALQKVYQEAERAKIRLSDQKAVEVEIPFLAANSQGPCHLNTRIVREEFEELITGFIDKTLRLTKGALQDAGLKSRAVDRVLLVGGSTRIPAIRRAVENLFGNPPEPGVNPEEVVACGAAVQAGILAGEAREMALVDVTPLGLGVETADEQMVTIVPRNAVLPVQTKALFTTVADFQKTAGIRVLQGERPRASDNISLGSFRLENIQMAERGEPDIEVCFDIDVEGIVHVSAQDLVTGGRQSVKLDVLAELDPGQIESIVTEARAAELEDFCAVD
ncbi:MAG: Hsp70 family protein [Spirochaetaceae bacterium]|nr:MAG: Hsp70 family protein [Spirochaetaceae bacterium]